MTLLLSTAHLLVEVVELRIPIRVLGAFGALAVRLQGVAELVQQLVDHTMTHRVPQRLQLGGELAHALGGPPQGAVVRLAGGDRLQQRVQVRDQRRVGVHDTLATAAGAPRAPGIQRVLRSQFLDAARDPRPRHAGRARDQGDSPVADRFGFGSRPQPTRALVQHRRERFVLRSYRPDVHS